MRKTKSVMRGQRFFLVVVALVFAIGLGLFADCFAIVSRAESQAKVTATSANIRKEANSTSDVVGSAKKDDVISIKSQVQGTDGYVWYQIYVNANTMGYIRSDLVQITDGSTPGTETSVPATSGAPTVEVSAVNPVSATVSGGSSVRVRSDASAAEGSSIVKIVSNGFAVTVTGTATGNDGKVWYQVSFSDNGAEVKGFIRSDYVTLAGELTPYVETPAPTEPDVPEVQPEVVPEPEVKKDFETMLTEGKWYLIDNTQGVQHDIQGLFDKVTNNAAAYEEANKTAKAGKVAIVILVLLLVAAGAVIALLVFKIKDMMDAAYFNEVEKETIKRREEGRAGTGRVMHTVGAEKPVTTKPGGARPTGVPQGQKPAGVRPAGVSQGNPQGQKPGGARPTGAPQGQKPAGARPTGAPQGQKPANADEKWHAINFMAEDDEDEFEFEFLNYDGEEE